MPYRSAVAAHHTAQRCIPVAAAPARRPVRQGLRQAPQHPFCSFDRPSNASETLSKRKALRHRIVTVSYRDCFMERFVEEEWLDQEHCAPEEIELSLRSMRLVNRRFGGDRLHA